MKGNEGLQRMLAPFIEMARTKYPALDEDEALGKLRGEVASLEVKANRLEERMKPRQLSAQQRNALIASLKSGPKGPVTLLAVMMDHEATKFAEELGSALRAVGFLVQPYEGPLMLSISPGVWVNVRSGDSIPAHADSLTKALNSIGVRCQLSAQPVAGSSATILAVGPKE